MGHEVRIYYRCKLEDVYKIQARFGIPRCTTVNGETCGNVTIKDEDWELLKETEKRGYIQIRNPKKL